MSLSGGEAPMTRCASICPTEEADTTGVYPRSERSLECANRIDEKTRTVVTSRSGAIRESSPDVATLLRVDRLPGKLLIAFVARQDTRAFRGWLRALHRPGASRSITVRLRPRGGDPFPASLSVDDVVDGGGDVIGLRWTIGT